VSRLQWLEALSHKEHGAPHQQMRHVLHALALYMNADGSGAWPSQGLIARRTLMPTRVVRRQLAAADRAGWVLRTDSRKARGKNWKQTAYSATVPPGFPAAELHARGEDSQSAPSMKLRTAATEGEDRECPKVRTGSPRIPRKKSLSRSLPASALAPEARAPRETADLESFPMTTAAAKRIMARIQARQEGEDSQSSASAT
jgi:hypothetical protein